LTSKAKAKTAQAARPKGGPFQVTIGALLLLAGLTLIVLELAWLVWWLVEPLPNAANIGGVVRRWMFLARALPEVVPGVGFRESYLGMALSELSHVQNLPQRVPVVLAAGLIAAAAVGLGGLVLRGLGLTRSLSMVERLPLSFGLGASGLGVVTLLFGRLGMLSPWPVRLGLAGLIVAEAVCLDREWRGLDRRNPDLF
jgi:hypothetical protein